LPRTRDRQDLTEASPDAGIAIALAALRAGEIVVYPSETFYGIAADAFAPAALERIFEIKGRDTAKTIALIAHDSAAAFPIAREVPEIARRLANAFWPGPLTIVMAARNGIPDTLIGPDGRLRRELSGRPASCWARKLKYSLKAEH
jgi:L-threonylcarbamoyladenylate synthase